MPKKWKSKKTIPLDVIQTWLKDPDWHVRTAAMNACSGRDVPLDVIQTGPKDPDCDVRTAAYKIARERGMNVCYRSFKPPALVYKKCEADVIVVARIPEDAEVRGNPSGMCRANKAEIVEIIGDFCGEPVGISKYDGTTWYYTGDKVEVEDFDLSEEECSTGYHFFCTRAQAEAY